MAITRRRGAKRAGNGGVWARGFFTGLASGALAAAVLYFAVLSPQPGDKAPSGAPKGVTGDAGGAKTITGPKPKFEFYTILPELEVPVPDQPAGDARQATVPPALQTPPPGLTGTPAPGATGAPPPALPAAEPLAPPPATGGRYILQAGSSRNAADAERLRASLALQGMSAQVQPVTVNGETWHRIRVGPFASRAEADVAQRQLHGARINTMLLELRNP